MNGQTALPAQLGALLYKILAGEYSGLGILGALNTTAFSQLLE